MSAARPGPAEGPWWTMAEASAIRATATIHVIVMLAILLLPAWTLARWGLPWAEPATFLRVCAVGYGALGVGLLRALTCNRTEGKLLVETVGFVKLGAALVVMLDVSRKLLPSISSLALLLDLVLGLLLVRMARRPARRS